MSTVTDGEEWCYISITPLDEEEKHGCVRAQDLELFIISEIE